MITVPTAAEIRVLTPLVGDSMLEFGNKCNERGTYKAEFESLGFRHVSIDLNGKDGALQMDLQQPLNLGRFDMVTNFGTTEHVACQAPAWQNAITSTQKVFVSTTPAPGSWPTHGKWYPTVEFYCELARLNAFRIEWLYLDDTTADKELICARFMRDGDVPFVMPDERLLFDNGDHGVGEAA